MFDADRRVTSSARSTDRPRQAGPATGLLPIESLLASYATIGMDDPSQLDPLAIKQICWALHIYYARIEREASSPPRAHLTPLDFDCAPA